MSDCMEVAEQVYEGGKPSKIPAGGKSNRDSHAGKQKGGEYASPTNTKNGRAGKRKTNNVGHPSDVLTRAKKTCLLHGPRHSSEECKVLKSTLKSTPCSGAITLCKPNLKASPSAAKLYTQEVNTMEIMVIQSQGRKWEQYWLPKSAISEA